MLLVTGATGNTGLHVVRRLVAAGEEIVALVRATSDTRELERLGVRTHVCELDRPETYRHLIEPGMTFVEMANLRHARAMMPHLDGIGRAHFVTTTAVFSTFQSYGALYREIEAEMRRSKVQWSILRPSMIYGNERDRNMHRLLRAIAVTPVFPVFGPGTSLMQPVHVDDLAAGIVAAVLGNAEGEFNLAGPEPLPFNDILMQSARAVGRPLRLWHVDHFLAASIVKTCERLPRFPIKHEQVMRLLEDKAFDIDRAVGELGYQPRSFADGIRGEADRLRALGII